MTVHQCHQADDGIEHEPHVIRYGSCEHESNEFCYGVPAEGSLEAQIQALQPGTKVRIVIEGVVEDSVRRYPNSRVRLPVVIRSEDSGFDRFVLRYTARSPEAAAVTVADVAGKHNTLTKSIEVIE